MNWKNIADRVGITIIYAVGVGFFAMLFSLPHVSEWMMQNFLAYGIVGGLGAIIVAGVLITYSY